MDKVWKRLCSFAVTAAITANALPLAVFAEPEQLVSLPETQLEQEILDSDTKLFWYRDNKDVCYIDVTKLIQEGIDDEGVLITSDDTDREYVYTDENGKTVYKYTEPIIVSTPATDSHAAKQSADFCFAEDANGSLFVLWTEGVTDEDGNVSSEIFATSLYSSALSDDADGEGISAWAKPYQITKDGYFHDEMAVTMMDDKLLTVYNRFAQTYDDSDDGTEYNGEVDHSVLTVSDMSLVATTLEPCGAVTVDDISVISDSEKNGVDLLYSEAGQKITVAVDVTNNGLTTAKGYKLTLYAVSGGSETKIGQIESTDELTPNATMLQTFAYTLPAKIDGLYFRAETQELKQDGIYYSEKSSFDSDPFVQRAEIIISNLKTYQLSDGFHMSYTLTNKGNADVSADDLLLVDLTGPLGLDRKYKADECRLYSEKIGELAIGESKEYDVIVEIPSEMLASYGFITAAVRAAMPAEIRDASGDVLAQYVDLSEWETVNFDLDMPVNMKASAVTVEVGDSAAPAVTMDLADYFGGNDVNYSVNNPEIARIENGKVVGISSGYATLFATHALTGETVTAKIAVTSDGEVEHEHHMTYVPAKEATETEAGNKAYYVCDDCEKWFEDEEGTQEITDHDSMTIPVINPEDNYFATIKEMCDMAIKDYDLKKSVKPANAAAEKNEDGSVSIVLSDSDGNVMAMVMAYYGKWVPLEQVRNDCSVSRNGLSAKSIFQAAVRYGFQVKAFKMTPDALRKQKIYPCIIHWNFNHFVVLCGFKGKEAIINDPARGKVRISPEEFDKSFTGVTLAIEPGDNFVRSGKPQAY